jgi:hypothetical protein
MEVDGLTVPPPEEEEDLETLPMENKAKNKNRTG